MEESHNLISAVPDWVCQVLSPGTVRKDKIRTMPFHARHEVHHAWLIDPMEKTIDILCLESGK